VRQAQGFARGQVARRIRMSLLEQRNGLLEALLLHQQQTVAALNGSAARIGRQRLYEQAFALIAHSLLLFRRERFVEGRADLQQPGAVGVPGSGQRLPECDQRDDEPEHDRGIPHQPTRVRPGWLRFQPAADRHTRRAQSQQEEEWQPGPQGGILARVDHSVQQRGRQPGSRGLQAQIAFQFRAAGQRGEQRSDQPEERSRAEDALLQPDFEQQVVRIDQVRHRHRQFIA
jgi:hypothetical protein